MVLIMTLGVFYKEEVLELITKNEFLEQLKELNNIREKARKQMISLEVSLNDYKTELAQLREKYNVDEIEKQFSEQFNLKHNSYENILKLKYKYIADLIYKIINSEILTKYSLRNKEVDNFFNWLFENYKIRYKRACNFIDFKTFYEDYLNETYSIIDIIYNNIEVKVYAEYWFRNEIDDEVELIIPISILDKIETVSDEINNYLDNLITEKEEEKRLEKEEREKQEYEHFLRLKEKYEK